MTENGTSCVSVDTEAFEVVESDGEEETLDLPPPAPAISIPTSEALIFESVEPDDVSHLRSSCAEGEASLVATGPQAYLQISVPSILCNQISIPVIPNTSGTYVYAVLDTGCQRFVVGRQWLRGAGIELEARFGLQVTPYRQPLMVQIRATSGRTFRIQLLYSNVHRRSLTCVAILRVRRLTSHHERRCDAPTRGYDVFS